MNDETLKRRLEEIEKKEILRALTACRWVAAGAARRLGMTERMIGYRMKKYGISGRGAGERAS